MSTIELINASCVEQDVDVIVNAANRNLSAGAGICGAIFRKAGLIRLTAECVRHKTPLKDGEAVITSACGIDNAKAIIHAVGPNFAKTPNAFEELHNAYYNSMRILMDNNYHRIAFPLISSGIFGGNLSNPVAESTKQCCKAYSNFIEDYPDYDIDVLLCAYSSSEMIEAKKEFKKNYPSD